MREATADEKHRGPPQPLPATERPRVGVAAVEHVQAREAWPPAAQIRAAALPCTCCTLERFCARRSALAYSRCMGAQRHESERPAARLHVPERARPPRRPPAAAPWPAAAVAAHGAFRRLWLLSNEFRPLRFTLVPREAFFYRKKKHVRGHARCAA